MRYGNKVLQFCTVLTETEAEPDNELVLQDLSS